MKILRVSAMFMLLAAFASAQDIPAPEEYFGHRVGADRKLISWDAIVSYLRLVGERSGRVNVREIGPTTAGRPFLLVEIPGEKRTRRQAPVQRLDATPLAPVRDATGC